MEYIKQHSLPVELMRVKGDEQTRVFFYKDGDEIKSCYVEVRRSMHPYDDDSYLITVDVYGFLDYAPLMRLRNLVIREMYLAGFRHTYVEMVMHLTDRDSELDALIKSDGQISTSMRLVESGYEDQRNRGFKERGYEVLGNQVSYRGSVKQAIEELHEVRTQINRNMEHLERQVGDVDRQLAFLEDALEA